MNILEIIDTIINNVLTSLGIFAPVLGCILILVESILPFLPLSVFITINAYYLGFIYGFIVSYIFTCLGCYFSYLLCKNKLSNYYEDYLNKKENKRLKKFTSGMKKLSLEKLTLLIALPFTPAFLVNIAAGLFKIDNRKYILSILIGKIFLVLFWEFIGTSLIESLKNPIVILEIVVMLTLAFLISKIVNKKFRLE